MRAEMMLETSGRSEELQYATRKFGELRGLILAPMVVGLLVSIAGEQLGSGSLLWNVPLAVSPLLMFATAWWYRHQYGRVVERDADAAARNWANISVAVVSLAFLLLHGSRFGQVAGTWALTVSVVAVFLRKCWSKVPAQPLLQVRRGMNGLAMLALLLSGFSCPVTGDSWLACYAAVVLVSACYDHWLLDRLLAGTQEKGGA